MMNFHFFKPFCHFGLLALLVAVPLLASQASSPQFLIYEGQLADDNGNPLSGSYDFRFSLWTTADHQSADNNADGSLNTASTGYRGWSETQTQTVTDGAFSFYMGKVTVFPAGVFDRDDLYLQVDIKQSGQAATSYELIDIDTSSSTVDRKVFASVPYAFNANKLDYRDVGLNPGDIPFIDPTTGKLDSSIIDAAVGGTSENVFTLDQDDNKAANDNLILQFGTTLAKTLLWNSLLGQFEFNDSLSIAGNLAVSGTINGVTLGEKDYQKVLSPRYGEALMDSDGTDNLGSMYERLDTVLSQQQAVLQWSSKQATMQDFEVLIKYQLPDNFKSFQTGNAFSFQYQTTGTAAQSKIDLTLSKSATSGDYLSSAGVGLSNASWTEQSFDVASGGSWMAGDVIWVKVKTYATKNYPVQISDVKFNLVVE